MRSKQKQSAKSSRWAITDKLFLSLFLTGVIIEFSQVGAGFIDGLVISRLLGPSDMAAQGIVSPIYSIIGVFSGLLAIGMQVRCTQLIGRGKRNEIPEYFSLTVYIGLALSLLFTVLIIVLAKPFAALLGASGNAAELLEPASEYLIGLGVGIPPMILSVILAPAIQLDNGRRTVQTGALIGAAADVVFDLLAVRLGLGILGVGLATAVSNYLNLGYQCLHFLRKDRMLTFIRPGVSVSDYLKMLENGSEKAFKRVLNTVRPIILNTIIITYGGTAAMTALSIRNNFANFTEMFGAGIASAVALLTGLYYGEINEEAIEEVNTYEKKMILLFCGGTCGLMLIFAPLIARLYVSENEELLRSVTFVIRMLALQNPLQALIANRIKYLQSTNHKVNMNLLIFTAQLAFVLLSAFGLGSFFGVYGILAAYTVSDALSLLGIYLFYSIKCRKAMPGRDDYLDLPKEFHLSPGDVISMDIRDLEDVELVSEQIQLFCKGHRIDRQIAYHAALSFEELATNTIEYGFPLNTASHPIIDLRAVITDNTFVIRMRDNCPHFDITEQIAKANAPDADLSKDIGIRIVSKAASEINYMRTLETNSIILRFYLKKD